MFKIKILSKEPNPSGGLSVRYEEGGASRGTHLPESEKGDTERMAHIRKISKDFKSTTTVEKILKAEAQKNETKLAEIEQKIRVEKERASVSYEKQQAKFAELMEAGQFKEAYEILKPKPKG